jgi:hypothetical protein
MEKNEQKVMKMVLLLLRFRRFNGNGRMDMIRKGTYTTRWLWLGDAGSNYNISDGWTTR